MRVWPVFLASAAPWPPPSNCWLTFMSLRKGHYVIDLVPRFNPAVYSYTATLGFNEEAFDLDAYASDGCAVDNRPNQAVPVELGNSVELTVYSRNHANGDRQQYGITVSRLLGTEMDLQSLRVETVTELIPPFDPQKLIYGVKLPATTDIVFVCLVLRDDGQTVRALAGVQIPAGLGDTPPSSAPAIKSGGRRLAEARSLQVGVLPAVGHSEN